MAWPFSKIRSFGSGFLIFSDYGKTPIRLAALMQSPVIYVFTHDSISLGEDSPTHEPIEQLASLAGDSRNEDNAAALADAAEVVEAWKFIMQRQARKPVALILSRQALPCPRPHEIRRRPTSPCVAATSPGRRCGRQAEGYPSRDRQRGAALH